MGYIRAVCISEKKGTGKKNVGEAVFIEDEGLKAVSYTHLEMEQLEEEYHEIRNNPLISDYLQYELGLCRIMQRINLSLVGTVDRDIGDFKDIIKW